MLNPATRAAKAASLADEQYIFIQNVKDPDSCERARGDSEYADAVISVS